MLVLEEDHLVRQQRGTDPRDLLVGEVARQVHAFHDRSDVGCQNAGGNFRHRVPGTAKKDAQYDCIANGGELAT